MSDVRTCPSCGADVPADGDWCLACGAAQPGRLGPRRGLRVGAAVVGACVVLVAGSGVAAYAAMEDSSARDAAAPGTAVSPDGVAQLAAVPPSYLPGKTNPAPPAGSAGTALPSLPGVPATSVPQATQVPQTSVPSVTPVTPSPSTAVPTATTTTPQATSTTPATTTTTPEEDQGPGDDGTTTSPTQLTPLDLSGALPSNYDPSNKAPDADASRALDGDDGTSWTIPTTAGEDPQVGLLVTLPERKRVRALSFTTKTPGFRAEVYVVDTSQIPAQITDTRWTHGPDLGSAKRTTTLTFGGNGQVTKSLVIWITRPAAQGDRVTIDDLQLLGK